MGNFPNLAGVEGCDQTVVEELLAAGIPALRLPESLRGKTGTREVPTVYVGDLDPWSFERGWRYWVAKGPGIPVDLAERLHAEHGRSVRVDGHCGCPSPREWFKGFAVGAYHVDTPDGLRALAAVVRGVLKPAPPAVAPGGEAP